MNQMIDQIIGTIEVVPQTLLMFAMKEVVAEVVSGGAWVNRTPWQVG